MRTPLFALSLADAMGRKVEIQKSVMVWKAEVQVHFGHLDSVIH